MDSPLLLARSASVRNQLRHAGRSRRVDDSIAANDRRHYGCSDPSSVETYSAHDQVEMPFELLTALRRFDGRDTGEVLDEIRDQDGLDLTPALIERLADFRILVW